MSSKVKTKPPSGMGPIEIAMLRPSVRHLTSDTTLPALARPCRDGLRLG